ncbi:Kinase-like protein [Mycena sanguinolenta]|uniref:Kinase-like protein n=1 Tax=Mycena sanguinolenta TaxID=230812 RepID=A0A8H6YC12_9AGAR|nr:Kinase-like protein [Mycena sanguinolenta]
MDPSTISDRILEFLGTSLPPLIHGKNHVRHSDTRPPIEYDYHMPPWLQPSRMEYGPGLSPILTRELTNALSQQFRVGQKSTIDQSTLAGSVDRLIDSYRTSYPMDDIVPAADNVVGEPTVCHLQHDIHRISGMFATLSCFDVDNNKVDGLRSVFRSIPSIESNNTKADLLVGCQVMPGDTAARWGSLWPSITQPRDLRHPFFAFLYTEEHKNIRSGGPLVILGIYIIMWCLKKKYLRTFWPVNECDHCERFIESHEADTSEMSESCPLDSPTAMAVTSDLEELRQEINRIIGLAEKYDTQYNIPSAQRTRKRKDPENDSDGEEEKSKQKHRRADRELSWYWQQLENALHRADQDLDLPSEMDGGILLNAAYILIQVWSQMVRHNGTIAHLTCHNLAVIITRHRKTRTLTVSEYLEHKDAPLLRATGMTVYAYRDAVERYEAHELAQKPHWLRDPFRGETQEEYKANKKARIDEEAQKAQEAQKAEKANKKARKAGSDDEEPLQEESDNNQGDQDVSDGDEDDDEDDDQDDTVTEVVVVVEEVAAVVEVAAERVAIAAEAETGALVQAEAGGDNGAGSSGKTPREQRHETWTQNRYKNSDLKMDLSVVHLAFRAPDFQLWSTGFSHFQRLAHATTATDETIPDLTPQAQDHGLTYFSTVEAFSLSEHQRRVSAGSSRSTTSTHTGVPSLFSAPSSVPTSPSTTASFPNASSRDGSPSPEKFGVEPGSSPSTSAVRDAGVLIDDYLGRSAIGTVWAGRMVLEDATEDRYSIPIAVKMAISRENPDSEGRDDERDEIRHEGLVYDYLAKSGKQGITPRYYGVFENNIGTVALILDDGGKALKTFKKLSNEQRQKLFAKVMEMHSAGVIHGDLEPRNVVEDSDRDLKIIDFHVAKMNHRCRGEMCTELKELRNALGL